MKTSTIILILIVFYSSQTWSQNPYTGDVTLTTQSEVISFGANNYTEILGTLIIDGPNSITDLSSLNSLTKVGDPANSGMGTGFYIRNNNLLPDLNGLNNLNEIIGTLKIENNDMLIDLSDFTNLTVMYGIATGLWINDNQLLQTLGGLESLDSLLSSGNLQIKNNPSLISILALDYVSINLNITIENNPSLTSLEGLNIANVNIMVISNNDSVLQLPNLSGTVLELTIDDMDGLVNLSGLENLSLGMEFFPGSGFGGLAIQNNDNLQTLQGLKEDLSGLAGVSLSNNPVLTNIDVLITLTQSDVVEIKNNDSLTSLAALSNFTRSRLVLEGNNSLTSLNGLENFTDIFRLELINTHLSSLEGLAPITDIGNSLILENNQYLTSIQQLENVTNIGNNAAETDFKIINNDLLFTLDAFTNLTSIQADIKFTDNFALSDYCGLTTALSNGFYRSYEVNGNNYNPSYYDISSGNCSDLTGDLDNDGISDGADNCPLTPNAGQEDLDNDGIGDACDNDIDGDGVSNEDEILCGTDPYNPDDFCIFTLIPDPNFEQALIDLNYDDILDGQVLTTNIQNVIELNVANKNIADLTGIQDFSDLEILSCQNNNLSQLNISGNATLNTLFCFENELISLDTSSNLSLVELNFRNNYITSFDVSQNQALLALTCGNNPLSTLDISQNINLTSLNAYSSTLTSIDLSQNINLRGISIPNNSLTSLDVSNNPLLQVLEFSNNQITAIDLSNNSDITALIAQYNQLSELETGNMPNLEYVQCFNNNIVQLDFSNNLSLENLECKSNALVDLDLRNGHNPEITNLNATDNPNLTCVYVDDKNNIPSNWDMDPNATYIETQAECDALSIDDFKSNLFAIYPNPTKNSFSIQSKSAVEIVSICDISGKLIKTFPAQNKYEVLGLSKGMYLVNIQSKTGSSVEKLIIE